MKKKVIKIIIESLKEVNVTLGNPKFKELTPDTQIFGSKGPLDSLGLVALIAIIETKISDEFDKEIIIASERAISQKSSPFKSVRSLAGFIEDQLREEK